jgi:hypothetical protein
MTAPADGSGTRIKVLMHIHYPAAFGFPEQTLPVRLTLRDGFARTADQARRKILDLVGRDQAFALEVVEQSDPFEFDPDRVRMVATWEEGDG